MIFFFASAGYALLSVMAAAVPFLVTAGALCVSVSAVA
jgi:hypothetical protein